MKKKQMLLGMIAIPLALGLAGCHSGGHSMAVGDLSGDGSGGGGSGGSGLTAGSYLATSVTDTAAKGLDDSKTLKANDVTASGVDLDYNGNTAKTHSGSTFSVTRNNEGGLDMNVNGETVSFAATDQVDSNTLGKDVGGANEKRLVAGITDMDSILDGSDTNYMQVWVGESDKDAATSTRFYAVTGAETSPDVVKNTANATYIGSAEARTFLAGSQNVRTRIQADMTLDADFAGGSVSGKLTNLEATQQDSHVSFDWTDPVSVAGGQIDMTKSKISANGFSGGALKGNSAVNAAIDGNLNGSTYSGRFYGPQAQEVGGVMNLKGTSEGEKFVGTGGFAGYK